MSRFVPHFAARNWRQEALSRPAAESCARKRARDAQATVEHIRLNFIAHAASKDVVVQALAVVMGFDDRESQTVPAYWTQHFRGNRARRLLSKHGTSPSRRLAWREPKTPLFSTQV
jgi:hypothetical protein